MQAPILRSAPVRLLRSNLYDLPCPANLSYFFAVGRLLGVFYILQLVSGLTLALTYETLGAFSHSIEVSRDYNIGWLFRVIHANGASALIFLLLFHIARGLYVGSFARLGRVWFRGCLLLILIILAAFSGYVLPWGQMSYWAATVILNLFSTVPYIGVSLVESMWGGPVVRPVTVSRIFTVHFLVPLVMFPLLFLHLASLHVGGSSNPIGFSQFSKEKKAMHPHFSSIDLASFVRFLGLFFLLILGFPDLFGMPENFQAPSPLSTPPHILPEWYFLPFYAVLRRVPQKTAGVILMALFLSSIFAPLATAYKPRPVVLFFLFINLVILLWLGGAPLEIPFTGLALGHRALHFFLLVLLYT